MNCFALMSGQYQSYLGIMANLTFLIMYGLIEAVWGLSLDSAIFVRLHSFDGYLHTTYNLTGLTPVKSRTACATICMKNPECGSFFYVDKPQKGCQPHTVLFMTTNEAVSNAGATYYQLTQARCPHDKGFVLYRPALLCYHYFEANISWTTSKQKCQSLQTHLLDVKTSQIATHIANYLNASSGMRSNHVSIGGTLTGTVWSWSDNIPFKWTNWGGSEPSGPNEYCLCMAYFYKFMWNDVPCDLYNRAYMCQLDI